jgi:hypothetical protein
MTIALLILAVQVVLGALDNILHHEITERLPSKPSARRELALHSAREAIYGVLFLLFAWTNPSGAFAIGIVALLVTEVAITIADFIEEDRTRNLPHFERVLHTVLAVGYGAFLALALPWLIARAGEPSALAFVSQGLLSWFFTLASIGVLAFAIRNLLAVRRLGRESPTVFRSRMPASGRTVLVTGATGFIGTALIDRLLARGDRILVLTRDRRQSRAVFGDHVQHLESLEALPAETLIDAVVNLAGAPVIGLPWTGWRRGEIWRSRIDLTNDLIAALVRLRTKPAVLVSASAIGIYGDRSDAVLTEEMRVGQGFGARFCTAWEEAAARAANIGVRVVCLRIGLVLDRAGGALPMMALPARFGLGAILGSGRQWMSWITRDDLLRMIVTAIDDQRWSGPINAVAPEPVRHADFQRHLARTLRRPLFLRAPAPILKLVLGEMSSIFLFSQRVVPARATELGFAFDVRWAADALALQFGPPPAPLPAALVPAPAVPRESAAPPVARKDAA